MRLVRGVNGALTLKLDSLSLAAAAAAAAAGRATDAFSAPKLLECAAAPVRPPLLTAFSTPSVSAGSAMAALV